jgi:cytochrome c2
MILKKVTLLLCILLLIDGSRVDAGIIVTDTSGQDPTKNAPIPPRKDKPDYFKPNTKHPLGVRPDCSEKSFSVDQLESLAKDSKIKSTVDLLNSLPADTFQTFTLVTNSKSAQRGTGENVVSEEYPRVLRTSADGKITFSYTCDPKSTTYNTVEVMYFDDKSRQMKTMSIDFKQQDNHRVGHNDQKCLTCHATTQADGSKSIKPIWPEYFQWGGCDGVNTINMYGSNDDSMNPEDFRYGGNRNQEYKGCSTQALIDRQKKEVESFKKFKEKNLGTGENNNPCYSTLPWAKPTGPEKSQYDPAKYPNYPYSADKKDTRGGGNDDELENYYLRPNLKFTEMYARLNAKRIAGIVEKSRNYDRIKYFLGLEASGCLKPEDEKDINRLLPGLKYTFKAKDMDGYSDPRRGSPLLYEYGKSIGLTDADWTLEFMGNDPTYNAAIPRKALDEGGPGGSDTGMAEVAGGEIVSLIGQTDPVVQPTIKDAFTRGTEEGFGPQWSCIDDLGGAVRDGFQGEERPLCGSLRNSLNEYLKTAQPDCETNSTKSAPLKLADDMGNVSDELDKDQVKKGAEIVKNRCYMCHQAGKSDENELSDLAFFPSSNSSKKTKENLSNRLNSRVMPNVEGLLKNGEMPASGEPLSSDDQAAVMMYMRSLKKK